MEAEKKTDLFQAGLLVLIVLSLVTNGILFKRLSNFQEEVALAFQNLDTQVPAEQTDRGLAKGEQAPSFEMQGVDGQVFTNEFLVETKTLMVFTATECSSCDRVYPMLKDISRSRADWQVLLVVEGTEDDVLALASDSDGSFPVVFWDREVAKKYLVSGTPFYTAIDSQGQVINSGYVMDRRNLNAMLGISGS